MHTPERSSLGLVLLVVLGCAQALHPAPRAFSPIHGEKARYHPGPPRLFGEATFRGIDRARASAALIAERGRHGHRGSAVYIGRGRYLTARHVLQARPGGPLEAPDRLEVRHADATWRIARIASAPQPLDAAVVTVHPDAHGAWAPAALAQPMDAPPVRLDDAVYVVGGVGARVADGAYVHFPFEASPAELQEILDRAAPHERHGLRAAYRDRGGHRLQCHRSDLDGAPALGIDSDTQAGMSGGGVYLKATGRLIGILVRGQPDRAEPWHVSWSAHEIALPLCAIPDM